MSLHLSKLFIEETWFTTEDMMVFGNVFAAVLVRTRLCSKSQWSSLFAIAGSSGGLGSDRVA